MSMGKTTRKKMFMDKSSLWSFTTNIPERKSLRAFMFWYFWNDDIIEKYFTLDSTTSSKSFKNITTDQKAITWDILKCQVTLLQVMESFMLERQDSGLFYNLYGISKKHFMN